MKYFLFDIGRVLVDFDFQNLYRLHAKHSGRPIVPFTEAELNVRDAVESGEITDAEWLVYLNQSKGLDWSMDDLIGIWSELFTLNQTGCQLFRKALQYEEISVHTLSNIAQHHMDAIEKNWNGFFDGADGLFLSYQMGVRKPNPKIYRDALDQLGVEARQCFFIDDLPENVAAATALGLSAHLFLPEHYVAIQAKAASFFNWTTEHP